MIDISIKSLDKIPVAKQVNFFARAVTIVEKLDGTKLTVFHNDVSAPPTHESCWSVSYRGNLIWPSEFDAAPTSDAIRAESVGYAQYALVWRWLQDIHVDIDHDKFRRRELFIEFLQRKSTLTRDYTRKHDLFLLAESVVSEVYADEFKYFGFEADPNWDRYDLLEFAGPLEIKLPQRLYYGHIRTCPFLGDDKNPTVALNAARRISEWLETAESSQGGPMEGVILRNTNGETYKVLRGDQHAMTARARAKAAYAVPDANAQQYWSRVKHHARVLLETPAASKHLSQFAFSLRDDELRELRAQPHWLPSQEDLLLTET
jgi:hypothetical protein